MDATSNSLQSVLILLASSVLAVAVCRLLKLPAMIGYVVTGLALGPHTLGLVSDRDEVRHLAEFGVVFLMFSIGLEFSLAKLMSMRRLVFGLGLAQVGATIGLAVLVALAAGASWQVGVALGGVVAMSSTAIVSRLLAERLELETEHGRQVMGVLLFQDLAVVPLLVLIPALGQRAEQIGIAVAIALGKAALALAVILLVGPRLMRAWLGVVARRRSNELFVLNVLLITLLLAFVTGLAGLSLVLGAFLAGMLISETEYRFRVEEDIKPFRDVLLGLFFITVGMMLDVRLALAHFGLVVLFLALVVGAKLGLITLLSKAFGAATGTALAGEPVVLADSSRREALVAAGIARAAAVVVSFADVPAAVRVLTHIHELNPSVPVIVRARDESDIERLTAAGASEVVPEAFESGVMLASHTLVLVGVPLSRVMRRMSQVRGEQYRLLRGLFHGAGDEDDGDSDAMARLRSVTLQDNAHAAGRSLAELKLDALGLQVRAVRRLGAKTKLSSAEAGRLLAGDVIVLLGAPDRLAAAEDLLLRG